MPLSLDGTGSITGIVTVSVSDDLAHVGDTNTKISFPANDTISFDTSGNERLRINSDGKVGLGTTGSDYALSIREADNNNKWLMLQKNSGQEILQIREDGAHHAIIDGSHASGELHFYTAGVEKARITSDGKVGINTTTPDTQLEVFGGSTSIQVGNQSGLGRFGADGTSTKIGSHSNHHLDLFTNGVANTRLRIASDGKIGINQTSPQALVHIGNYETSQNENQSTVTQYFIDSTRSLKIARCNRGSVSNAGWYDVAVLANSGYSYRCQVSIGGDFTQDVVDIDIQMAYGATLGNKYSMQIHAKSACAHSNDRIIKVRVAVKNSVYYLQVYLQNVNSNTNGKSVLETTCGIYAQNGADNAYPMFAAASGSYSNICTTFPDFGVHASWDITVNSSHVRSYTALTGGSQIYVTAENAGNGSSHGTVGRFTAPMRGLYQVNLNAKAIITPSRNNNILLSMYGSMTYDSQNVWTTNAEVYDPRGAVAGAQGQQGEGNSWYLRMAAYDYFSIDWYRPAATGYTNGGGDIFNISVLKMG